MQPFQAMFIGDKFAISEQVYLLNMNDQSVSQ